MGLRTTPAVAEVQYHGLCLLERPGKDLLLQQPLILCASVGPHANIADRDAMRVDNTCALLHGFQKCLIGFGLLRHDHDLMRRCIKAPAHLQGHLLIDFCRQGSDRMIGSAISSQEFIAHVQISFGGWESIEDATNEGFIADTLCQNSDTWIYHLPVRKDPS